MPESTRKVTVKLPAELLERAGSGDTGVQAGIQLVAASDPYAQLRQMRGKVQFSLTAAELKDDR